MNTVDVWPTGFDKGSDNIRQNKAENLRVPLQARCGNGPNVRSNSGRK